MYKIWTIPVRQKFGVFLSTRLKYLYNQEEEEEEEEEEERSLPSVK